MTAGSSASLKSPATTAGAPPCSATRAATRWAWSSRSSAGIASDEVGVVHAVRRVVGALDETPHHDPALVRPVRTVRRQRRAAGRAQRVRREDRQPFRLRLQQRCPRVVLERPVVLHPERLGQRLPPGDAGPPGARRRRARASATGPRRTRWVARSNRGGSTSSRSRCAPRSSSRPVLPRRRFANVRVDASRPMAVRDGSAGLRDSAHVTRCIPRVGSHGWSDGRSSRQGRPRRHRLQPNGRQGAGVGRCSTGIEPRPRRPRRPRAPSS